MGLHPQSHRKNLETVEIYYWGDNIANIHVQLMPRWQKNK